MRPRRLTLVLALSVWCLIGANACSKDGDDSPTGPPAGLELNSGDILNGTNFAHTFNAAGTFGYHCTKHGGMSGTVNVADGNPMTATVDIPGNVFSPNLVTIAPGGTVTWTNGSGATHTVTSH